MKTWIIVDENMNFVTDFESYRLAVEDAVQAAKETGEKFSVCNVVATIAPETSVRVDILP